MSFIAKLMNNPGLLSNTTRKPKGKIIPNMGIIFPFGGKSLHLKKIAQQNNLHLMIEYGFEQL